MMPIPHIFEHDEEAGNRSCDVVSRLLMDRIILLNGPITSNDVPTICSQLLFLDAQNSTKPVYLYINSPGGEVGAGLAMYDTMRFLSAPVATICMGDAMSMAAVLLASGTKGMRYSLPHSRIMIHEPSGGFSGCVSDIKIHVRQITQYQELINQIMAENCGKTMDTMASLMERDNFLSPNEALDLGLIDTILYSRADLRQAA